MGILLGLLGVGALVMLGLLGVMFAHVATLIVGGFFLLLLILTDDPEFGAWHGVGLVLMVSIILLIWKNRRQAEELDRLRKGRARER